MAVTSKSTLKEVLDDPRAVAVIEEYKPGFMKQFGPMLKPFMGMQAATLLSFPQAGFNKDQIAAIIEKLDALDA